MSEQSLEEQQDVTDVSDNDKDVSIDDKDVSNDDWEAPELDLDLSPWLFLFFGEGDPRLAIAT